MSDMEIWGTIPQVQYAIRKRFEDCGVSWNKVLMVYPFWEKQGSPVDYADPEHQRIYSNNDEDVFLPPNTNADLCDGTADHPFQWSNSGILFKKLTNTLKKICIVTNQKIQNSSATDAKTMLVMYRTFSPYTYPDTMCVNSNTHKYTGTISYKRMRITTNTSKQICSVSPEGGSRHYKPYNLYKNGVLCTVVMELLNSGQRFNFYFNNYRYFQSSWLSPTPFKIDNVSFGGMSNYGNGKIQPTSSSSYACNVEVLGAVLVESEYTSALQNLFSNPTSIWAYMEVPALKEGEIQGKGQIGPIVVSLKKGFTGEIPEKGESSFHWEKIQHKTTTVSDPSPILKMDSVSALRETAGILSCKAELTGYASIGASFSRNVEVSGKTQINGDSIGKRIRITGGFSSRAKGFDVVSTGRHLHKLGTATGKICSLFRNTFEKNMSGEASCHGRVNTSMTLSIVVPVSGIIQAGAAADGTGMEKTTDMIIRAAQSSRFVSENTVRNMDKSGSVKGRISGEARPENITDKKNGIAGRSKVQGEQANQNYILFTARLNGTAGTQGKKRAVLTVKSGGIYSEPAFKGTPGLVSSLAVDVSAEQFFTALKGKTLIWDNRWAGMENIAGCTAENVERKIFMDAGIMGEIQILASKTVVSYGGLRNIRNPRIIPV